MDWCTIVREYGEVSRTSVFEELHAVEMKYPTSFLWEPRRVPKLMLPIQLLPPEMRDRMFDKTRVTVCAARL